MRHAYQKSILVDDIFISQWPSNVLSVTDYNLHPLEVDANAFGAICMIEITSCKPLFNGFSDEVKQAIDKRQMEILCDEFWMDEASH